MRPNLAKIKAALTKNKAVIGVLGAVAVGALAWRARSTSTGSSASSAGGTTSAGTSTPPGYYSTGGQSGGATGYDSSASDVYNAIQPQLEALGTLIDKQLNTPVPVPAPAPTPAPAGDPRRTDIGGFYQTILGRSANRAEVNFWDSTGFDLAGIRSRILKTPEAQKVTK